MMMLLGATSNDMQGSEIQGVTLFYMKYCTCNMKTGHLSLFLTLKTFCDGTCCDLQLQARYNAVAVLDKVQCCCCFRQGTVAQTATLQPLSAFGAELFWVICDEHAMMYYAMSVCHACVWVLGMSWDHTRTHKQTHTHTHMHPHTHEMESTWPSPTKCESWLRYLTPAVFGPCV